MHRMLSGIGWGIIIYAVMYLAWSGLVIYGLSIGVGSLVARLVLLVVLTTIAARALRLTTVHDLVPVAFVWAVIAALLDSVFLVPFTDWALYASWSVWAGYALIIIAPVIMLFATGKMRRREQIAA